MLSGPYVSAVSLSFRRRQLDGFLPRDLFEMVPFAQQGYGQALGVMDELMGNPALHAERAAADGVFPVGVGGRGAAFLHLHDKPAARAAIGADGSNKLGVHGFFPMVSTQSGTSCPGRGSFTKSKRTGDFRFASSPAS